MTSEMSFEMDSEKDVQHPVILLMGKTGKSSFFFASRYLVDNY
jgi:hypothetical protein